MGTSQKLASSSSKMEFMFPPLRQDLRLCDSLSEWSNSKSVISGVRKGGTVSQGVQEWLVLSSQSLKLVSDVGMAI